MNGYGTNDGLTDYATATGMPLPNAANVSAARLRASIWLDAAYEPRFPGARSSGIAQERAWPRTGAQTRSGFSIPDDAVPLAVINASYEAAIREANNPGSLAPDITVGKQVKRTKVGPLEKEYATTGEVADFLPVYTVIDGMLADYLISPCEPAVIVV